MTEFQVPTFGQLNAKPTHLVVLKEKIGVAKNAHNRCFISIDQPGMSGVSFIQAKGFFSDETAEAISEKFKEIVQTTDKEKHVEVCIPWDEISHIKNLVYRAK